MQLLNTQRNPTLKPKDFVFLPGSFRFGADHELTVITAYLAPTQKLFTAANRQKGQDQSREPAAFILAYDVECSTFNLFGIDTQNTQFVIRLSPSERASLYKSLQIATRKQYNANPEIVLGWIRKDAGMPPLNVQPFLLPQS